MEYYISRAVVVLGPYLSVIKSAFAAFPIAAFIITLPYMIWQYKKFGSIPLLRTAVVYSFVLYAMTVYYLAILPLPTIESVAASAPMLPNFVPYTWVKGFVQANGISPASFAWWKTLVKSFSFRETFFNICMFFPLGVYLRYYFKAKFPRTLITGFLCSLFIELTQLSGLYFIYPHAYRTFDTTDLCNNTLGAVIGFLLTPLICFFLPSREKLDERAYKRGTKVPLLRRLIGLSIDWLIYVVLAVVTESLFLRILPAEFDSTIFYQTLYVLFILVYFVLLQWLFKGRTLGHIIMKTRIVGDDVERATLPRLLLRYVLLYGFTVPAPFYALAFAHIISSNQEGAPLIIGLAGLVTCGILMCIFASDCLMKLLGSEHDFLYGRISKTKCVSTIKIPQNVKAAISSEEDKK